MKAIIFFALVLVGFSLQQTTPATTPSTTPAGTAATGGTTSGGVTAQCPYPPVLGETPSLFNVFVFEDFVGLNSEVRGRLAAGGDVTLTSYTVATDIPLVVCPAQTGGSGGYTGTPQPGTTSDSSNTTTEWFDNLVVGGVLTWDTGSLGSGNIVVGQQSQISPTVTAGLQQPCGVVVNPARIDFVSLQANLTETSLKLANLGQDTKVTATLDASNILTIPLDLNALESESGSGGSVTPGTSDTSVGTSGSEEAEDKVQVIDVSAADLLAANTVTYQGATAGTSTPSTTPAGTTPVATTPVPSTPAGTSVTPSGDTGVSEIKTVLVFNVRGSPCGFQNAGLQSLAPWSKKIIWNFIDCTEMTIEAVSVPGTVLAPLASVNGNNGNLDGQLIAKSFNGSLEFLNTLFEGCVDLSNVTAGTAGTQAGTQVGTQGTAVQPTVAPGTTPTLAARNIQPGWWGWDDEEDSPSSSSALATAIAPMVVALVYLLMK